MTEMSIKDFRDSLLADSMIQNITRSNVTICSGTTCRWLLYLKQRMNVAEQRVIGDFLMEGTSQATIMAQITRKALTDIAAGTVRVMHKAIEWATYSTS